MSCNCRTSKNVQCNRTVHDGPYCWQHKECSINIKNIKYYQPRTDSFENFIADSEEFFYLKYYELFKFILDETFENLKKYVYLTQFMKRYNDLLLFKNFFEHMRSIIERNDFIIDEEDNFYIFYLKALKVFESINENTVQNYFEYAGMVTSGIDFAERQEHFAYCGELIYDLGELNQFSKTIYNLDN